MSNKTLNTSKDFTVSGEKLGRITDLLAPILKRNINSELAAQGLIESKKFLSRFENLVKDFVGYNYANNPLSLKVSSDPLIDLYERTIIHKGDTDRQMMKRLNEDSMIEEYSIEVVPMIFQVKNPTFHFAMSKARNLNLRPANIRELFCFVDQYPEFTDNDYTVSCLGTIVEKYITYIDRESADGYPSITKATDDDFYGLYMLFAGEEDMTGEVNPGASLPGELFLFVKQ